MTEPFVHLPVMAEEITNVFSTVPEGVVLDATLGGGGHAELLLERYGHLRVLGLDRDEIALSAARQRLARFGDRLMVHHCRFDRLEDAMEAFSVETLSGALFDLGVSSPQLNFRMASTNNAATWCFYVEVYRISTSTLIGTHGSSGAPTCNSGTTQTTTQVSLPEVTTTTIANDLRVRIYVDDSKSKNSATDMATITGSTPYSSFTAYEQVYRDASSGTPAATNWAPASSADTFAYTTAAAWLATFATTRYVKLTFDPGLPVGAVITAASLDFAYRSTSAGADTACWYMETYNGATLLAAHGSSAATISCNSTTSYRTDNVSLPEVATVANANSLTVKAYMDDTLVQKTQLDLVRLNLTYYLD